ncbi:MAG: dTMP kinase [Desulfurococcaceae archaeon TW002]
MSYFIVFEGLDGSGKTTVSLRITEALKREGFRVLYTYEPYSEDFIKLINDYGRRLGGVMEAYLMAADRYNHVVSVIVPALRDGLIVVGDRYYYSSLAYQGAKNVDIEWIRTLNRFAPEPDLAIYLDIEPSLGLRRKQSSTTKIKYLEEDENFLHRVRAIYKELVTKGLMTEVDASNNLENVIEECVRILCKKLKLLCTQKNRDTLV